MKELEMLLRQRWILKADQKEQYYRIRDNIGEVRKFASDKLGCQIIENSLLVKMEKVPVKPEEFMGIQEFSSKEEYAFLCILLMFLEDKDAKEQFILSQLTEYIVANTPGEVVDWTMYTHRRRLIKVLRYAVTEGILRITDGNDEAFMDDMAGEVLYENTGASRYFMRNFTHDIMTYTKPEDFGKSDWLEMDEDRGFARRHRVYRQLLFEPAMYRVNCSEEDFEYLKYYGGRLREDLEKNFDCQIHIHKGSAFFLNGEECRMGEIFPGNNVLSDILLLSLAEIQQHIQKEVWTRQTNETYVVSEVEFEKILSEVKQKYRSGFTKNYREMPQGEFVKIVEETMERWMFIQKRPLEHQVLILPACGKLKGRYPQNFTGGQESEQ